MRHITSRLISDEEASVLRQTLLHAAIGEVAPTTLNSVDTLKVIAECECGCRSLYFLPDANGTRRIADGVGYLADGTRVELLVWAVNEAISLLEVVDHGGAGKLPCANSVCSWEEAGRRTS